MQEDANLNHVDRGLNIVAEEVVLKIVIWRNLIGGQSFGNAYPRKWRGWIKKSLKHEEQNARNTPTRRQV